MKAFDSLSTAVMARLPSKGKDGKISPVHLLVTIQLAMGLEIASCCDIPGNIPFRSGISLKFLVGYSMVYH